MPHFSPCAVGGIEARREARPYSVDAGARKMRSLILE
jgi:hypothetical protein